MSEGILTLRWSGFPNEVVGKDLYVNSQLLLIEDAKKNLSEEQYISAIEREEQLKIRAQSYAWRIEE